MTMFNAKYIYTCLNIDPQPTPSLRPLMPGICDELVGNPAAITQLSTNLMAHKIIPKPTFDNILQAQNSETIRVTHQLINSLITHMENHPTNSRRVVSTFTAALRDMGFDALADKISESCSKHKYNHLHAYDRYMYLSFQKMARTENHPNIL